MGNYTSIEQLKADGTLRNRIKQAINAVYDIQKEYKSTTKYVTNVSVRSEVISTNKTTSGKGVMIGVSQEDAERINILQKSNAVTIVKTAHIGNYLSRVKDPIVQIITSDMMGLGEEDALETEAIDFYKPKEVLEMLGIEVDDAAYDFKSKELICSIPSQHAMLLSNKCDLGIYNRNPFEDNVPVVIHEPDDESESEQSEEPHVEVKDGSEEIRIPFGCLYEMLCDGYMKDISVKIRKSKELSTTIVNNIKLATYNYQRNYILINGRVSGGDIFQSNESIQLVYEAIITTGEDAAKLYYGSKEFILDDDEFGSKGTQHKEVSTNSDDTDAKDGEDGEEKDDRDDSDANDNETTKNNRYLMLICIIVANVVLFIVGFIILYRLRVSNNDEQMNVM